MQLFINFGWSLNQVLLVDELMATMETKILQTRDEDKPLWFSMWFLISVTTFGLAVFPMFYQFIQRRNRHFLRQENQAQQVSRLKGVQVSQYQGSLGERNAKLWTASLVLLFPIFVITYLLSRDLILHERRERELFSEFPGFPEYMAANVSVRKYAIITLVTVGVGVIYWLYKIINIYNSHFKLERPFEALLAKWLEEQ